MVAAHPPPAPNPHAEADPPPPAPTPQRPRFACLPPFLRYVAPPLRGTASTVTVAPFPPVAVAVTGAVAGALVKPCFSAESNELPLQDVNSISFLLDQLVYFLFCHCDEAVIKSQIGSASLSVRLLFDCSVVLFSFPQGDKAIRAEPHLLASTTCGSISELGIYPILDQP